MRILILSPSIPFSPVGGGKTRTYHLLRALMPHNSVTIVGFSYGSSHTERQLPVEVIAVNWTEPMLYQEMRSTDIESMLNKSQFQSRVGTLV